MASINSARDEEPGQTSLRQLDSLLTHFREACAMKLSASDTKGGDSAYEVGWAIVDHLMLLAPLIANADQCAVQAIRLASGELGDLYRTADEAVQRCIVDAILEHLFEEPALASHFEAWQLDPVLHQAFNDATEWAEHLRRVRAFLKELQPLVLSQLQARGYLGLQEFPFDLGSDVLVFGWVEGQQRYQRQLAVECADLLVEVIAEGGKPSSGEIERYVAHVINLDNWRESEYLEGEFLVTLPLEP